MSTALAAPLDAQYAIRWADALLAQKWGPYSIMAAAIYWGQWTQARDAT